VLDVGTGGGVPGVVMAALRPDLQIELCESVGKRAKATQEIVDQIQLALPLHHGRGEAILADRRYDAVVVRAVAPLVRMLKWFTPHWSNMGCLLAIKGTGWVAERGEARHHGYLKTLELRRATVYKTPGTGAESVILKIWPKEK
jgi:16S rRNA (guanine527-N7)-methyltransferase